MLDLSGLLDLFFAIDETDKTIRATSSSLLILDWFEPRPKTKGKIGDQKILQV
jgi:hypothetical protein